MTKTRKKDINANDRLRKEFKATIVVGLPASGRSANIVRPLSREQAAFALDSNEMNKLIPEYMGGLGACLVHEEGKMLTEQAFKEFTRGSMKGVNLVIPVVGYDADKLNIKYILPLLDAGYDVEIACTRADAATCANRVVAKAIEGGVFIPREVVMSFDDRAVLGAYNEVLATDYGGKRVKRSKYSEIK